MAWFQPCFLEPLYKFELLGLLFSLAVYNGLTLPVTFPKAFYRKLLGLPVTDINHIQDGWPELSKGLTDLIQWTDGDVADVFVRTYEFSMELFGKRVNVDMLRTSHDADWPQAMENVHDPKTRVVRIVDDGNNSMDETDGWVSFDTNEKSTHFEHPHEVEAELVTNENREQFVKDYIFWLTDKSIRPQYEAFARGFFVCIDKKTISVCIIFFEHFIG